MGKKEDIILAARELFTKFGYKKVSMDEIARSAGVTKKTIYSYFKDKDSLVTYCINEDLKKMKKNIEEEEKKEIPFIEIVSNNIYDMLTYQYNSTLMANISKEALEGNIEQCKKFLKIYEQEIIEYISLKIKQEIEKGNVKECDANLTAFITYKVCLALMFEYDEKIDSKRVTKEITSILKEGLLK